MKISIEITLHHDPPQRAYSSHLVGEPNRIVMASGQPAMIPGKECIAWYWTIRDQEWIAMVSICPHGRVHVSPMTWPKKIMGASEELQMEFIELKVSVTISVMFNTLRKIVARSMEVAKAKGEGYLNP